MQRGLRVPLTRCMRHIPTQSLRNGARNHQQRPRWDKMLEVKRVIADHEIVAHKWHLLAWTLVVSALGSIVSCSLFEERIRILWYLNRVGRKHGRCFNTWPISFTCPPGFFLVVLFTQVTIACHTAQGSR